MIPALPPTLLARPIAHRALHDRDAGRPENSLAAVKAAVSAGYGIEIDLQLSGDGQAMVFHDYGLERLTGTDGTVQLCDAASLGALRLKGGDEGIPRLSEVLDLVAGRVPLLIELKDQDGSMGPNVGILEAETVRLVREYTGAVALMSYNPHSVAELARLAPDLPRGLTTEDFPAQGWPQLEDEVRAHLRKIPDFDRVGASFVSHDRKGLGNPRVAALKARGVPILCWTVRSPEQEADARQVADNITFEGYAA